MLQHYKTRASSRISYWKSLLQKEGYNKRRKIMDLLTASLSLFAMVLYNLSYGPVTGICLSILTTILFVGLEWMAEIHYLSKKYGYAKSQKMIMKLEDPEGTLATLFDNDSELSEHKYTSKLSNTINPFALANREEIMDTISQSLANSPDITTNNSKESHTSSDNSSSNDNCSTGGSSDSSNSSE